MTQQNYYVGDIVGYKSSFTAGGMYTYFAGAVKVDAGWEVSLAFTPVASGMGGSMFVSKFVVRPGETIRLAKQFQMYVDKDGNPQKTKAVSSSELRIFKVEQDCLTVEVLNEL